MRIAAYTLLITGFLWLTIWCAGSIVPLTRSIGMENYKKYPPGKTYSDTEVCTAIHDVLIEYQENAHGIVLPAAVMLVGGVLLDVGKRTKKQNV